MQPPSGPTPALSGEVRAALLREGNRLADAGLRGNELVGQLNSLVISTLSRARTISEDERAAIAQGAGAVAAQWEQIDLAQEALEGGFILDLEAPLLSGAPPGNTVDVQFQGDLGTGRGLERLFVRLTDQQALDLASILDAVGAAFAAIVRESGDPERASFDPQSLSIRGLYRGA